MNPKSICLNFKIHIPCRLKTYRFFNMGCDHAYFDEPLNRRYAQIQANESIEPFCRLVDQLCSQYPEQIRLSLSVTGQTLDQLRNFTPDVYDHLQRLFSRHTEVEAVCIPDSWSISSLSNVSEFRQQTESNRNRLHDSFGCTPRTFANTDFIYSDSIGETVYNLGFTTMLTGQTEMSRGVHATNNVQTNALNPRLRLLARNDTVCREFITGAQCGDFKTFKHTLRSVNTRGETLNIFVDLAAIGNCDGKPAHDFLSHLARYVIETNDYAFDLPQHVASRLRPAAVNHSPVAVGCHRCGERISALDNELQREAFRQLYRLSDKVHHLADREIDRVWSLLQTSDHFYYMNTAEQPVPVGDNPYGSPFEAFINYMNVLGDFSMRLTQVARS